MPRPCVLPCVYVCFVLTLASFLILRPSHYVLFVSVALQTHTQVQWIDRGHERDEPLVSISTDGRVTQWSIAKGLEYSDLMALKRVPRKATAAAAPLATAAAATAGGAANAAKGGKGGVGAEVRETDAFISRLTSGMSFDFSAKDQRIYIAGTYTTPHTHTLHCRHKLSLSLSLSRARQYKQMNRVMNAPSRVCVCVCVCV